jgi:hypothetical protein
MTKISLLIASTLGLVSVDARSLDVLSRPEYKECADEWYKTRHLSPYCDDLWHKIEDRMKKEAEEAKNGVGALLAGTNMPCHSTSEIRRDLPLIPLHFIQQAQLAQPGPSPACPGR